VVSVVLLSSSSVIWFSVSTSMSVMGASGDPVVGFLSTLRISQVALQLFPKQMLWALIFVLGTRLACQLCICIMFPLSTFGSIGMIALQGPHTILQQHVVPM